MQHRSLPCLILLGLSIVGCESRVQSTGERSNLSFPDLNQEAILDLEQGRSFPFDFAVRDITGRSHQLADYRGKVLIVDFWATWCPPCRREIPSFIKLQNQLGPNGLQVFGLNFEHESGLAAVDKVRRFVEANGINYPCALGTADIKSLVPGFRGYPTTLFIDRTGRVRLKIVGLHDYTYLETVARQLLGEPAS